MMRAYLAFATCVVLLFGYAQHQHWSVYGNDAGTREAGGGSSSSGTRGK